MGAKAFRHPRLKPEGKQMKQKELHIGNSMAVMEQQLWGTGRKEGAREGAVLLLESQTPEV